MRQFKNNRPSLKHSLGLNDEDLYDVALLGAVRKEGRPPSLLYALSSHQHKQQIYNILQVSGQILGQSRAIFLGKVLLILRAFDPAKLEILYTGKQ